MARSNVVITNGTKPLTFTPFQGQVGQTDPAQWLEKSYGTFIGYGKLSLLTSRTKGAKGALATSINLQMPKIVMASGVESVLHTAFFQGKFVIPDTMVEADRLAFSAYVADAIKSTVVTDSVVAQIIAD